MSHFNNSIKLHRVVDTADTDPKTDGSDSYSDLTTGEKADFIKISPEANNVFVIVEPNAASVTCKIRPLILNFYDNSPVYGSDNYGVLDGNEVNGVYSWGAEITLTFTTKNKVLLPDITPGSYLFIKVTELSTAGEVSIFLEEDRRDGALN